MSDLVRVRVNDIEFNVGRAYATAHKLNVLDEPTHDRSGNPRPETRAGGRPRKPRTTVAEQAAAKKAASTADSPTTNPPSMED